MSLNDLAPTWQVAHSSQNDWHHHENGGGWVYKTAHVEPTAYVGPGALVYGTATVRENAVIKDYARIFGNAWIAENARIKNYACVEGRAIVCGNAVISDEAYITDLAYIGGDAHIIGNAWVGGNMSIITGTFDTPKPQKRQKKSPEETSNFNPYLANMYPVNLANMYPVKPFPSVKKAGELIQTYPINLGYLNKNFPWMKEVRIEELNEMSKPKNMTLAANFVPRTQKAKGIHALAVRGLLQSSVRFHKIETADPEKMVGKFVRPCPMTPRHGFVDSRMAETLEEARKIVEETRVVDEQAEFITMPFVDSKYSGIFTPGLLSVGLGHDGATAGTSSISFPAIGNYPRINASFNPSLFKDAGIKDSEYVEILWEEQLDLPQPVQLRDGPRVSQETDYITVKTKVKRVIRAEGDLLEWETKMKKVPAGTVVYHPNGSLASHYAIHAILNKVPLAISFEPKVGEILEPKTESKEINLDLLKAGFIYAQKLDITENKYEEFQVAAKIMLSALHHISVWAGRYDFLIGVGMGLTYRLTVLATLGEYRHNRRKFKGSKDRDIVYIDYWSKVTKKKTYETMIEAMKSFACDRWPGNYGGIAWFTFAKHATDMLNHLIAGDITESLEAYNRCVNAAHNNGWAFNKFCGNTIMTEAAQNPMTVLLAAAPTLYHAVQAVRDKELISGYTSEFEKLEKYPEEFFKPSEVVNNDDNEDEEEDGEDEEFKLAEPVAELQFKTIASQVHVQYRTQSHVGLGGYETRDIENAFLVTPIDINAEVDKKIEQGLAKPSKSFGKSEADYISIVVDDEGKFEPWQTIDFSPFMPENIKPPEDESEDDDVPF